MKLKEGYGYWVTTHLPIGGDFRRAPKGGLTIISVIRTFAPCRGADTEGRTADGRTVAYDSAHAE